MNMQMVKTLVRKDLFLLRHILLLYILGGLLSIAVALLGGEIGFMVGGIALVAAVMGVGIHLVFNTVVNERKLQTLPFIMSLPVSVKDYTMAKIAANATAFLVPWLFLSVVTLYTVYSWDAIPNGSIPILTIMLVELAVCNFIILAAAIVTESEGWTIATMAVCNTAFSIIFILMKKVDGIGEFLSSNTPTWNSTVFSVLALELVIIVITLLLVFHLQSKKTDFL